MCAFSRSREGLGYRPRWHPRASDGAIAGIIMFLSFLLMAGTATFANGEGFYSACSLAGDSEWQDVTPSNAGSARSWMFSLIPSNDSATEGKLEAEFFLTNLKNGNIPKQRIRWARRKEGGAGWASFGTMPHDGWLYGAILPSTFKDDDELDKSKSLRMAFVYPDFSTAIVGRFSPTGKKRMPWALNGGSGVPARVSSIRCRGGILELRFKRMWSREEGYSSYSLAEVTPLEEFPKTERTKMDPYDRRNVFVNASRVVDPLRKKSTGDGLFAKRNIPVGTLAVTYAGTKVIEDDVLHENMTVAVRTDYHKNLLYFDEVHTLDVPPEFTSVVAFRAGLGHKINHSFKPNTDFCFFTSPRFGHVRGIVTTRPVKKGEELLVDYDYNTDSGVAPRWYMDQLKVHEYQQKKKAEKNNKKKSSKS